MMPEPIRHYISSMRVCKSTYGVAGVWFAREGEPEHTRFQSLYDLTDHCSTVEDAFRELNEYIVTSPDDAQALTYLAALMIQQSFDLEKVLPLMLNAVRIEPLTANIRYTLGIAFYAASKVLEARREWRVVRHLTGHLSLIGFADQMLVRSKTDLGAQWALAETTDHEDIVSPDLVAEIQMSSPGPMAALADNSIATIGIADRLRDMASANNDSIWIRFNLAATLIGIGQINEGASEVNILYDLARSMSNNALRARLTTLLSELQKRIDAH